MDKFDSDYNNIANIDFQRKKQRGFSENNPLDPKNKLYGIYVVPDKLLEKPGNIDLRKF